MMESFRLFNEAIPKVPYIILIKKKNKSNQIVFKISAKRSLPSAMLGYVN